MGTARVSIGTFRVGAGLMLAATSPALAASLYGGPTFSGPATYTSPGVPSSSNQRAIDGVGIGFAQKSVGAAQKGLSAWRWDSTGAVIRLMPYREDLPDNAFGTGGSWALPTSINASGVIVGTTAVEASGGSYLTRAARWDTAGNVTVLPSQFGTGSGDVFSSANDIDNAGNAVGAAVAFSSGGDFIGQRAAVWNSANQIQQLASPLNTDSSGFGWSYANAISQTGFVVGGGDQYQSNSYRGSRALRWSNLSSTAVELSNLPDAGTTNGESNVIATGVNDSGVAIGESSYYVSNQFNGTRAVRWNAAGTPQLLQTTGLTPDNNYFARATDINNAGAVVGYAEKYDQTHDFQVNKAYRWDASSGTPVVLSAYDLGNGLTNARAYSINENGITVGYSELLGNGRRAVAWLADGTRIDLNDFIDNWGVNEWQLQVASTITEGDFDDVWITGTGLFDPDGFGGGAPAYERMFLLHTAIPEPASLSLLAMSGLALRRRRHTHR